MQLERTALHKNIKLQCSNGLYLIPLRKVWYIAAMVAGVAYRQALQHIYPTLHMHEWVKQLILSVCPSVIKKVCDFESLMTSKHNFSIMVYLRMYMYIFIILCGNLKEPAKSHVAIP